MSERKEYLSEKMELFWCHIGLAMGEVMSMRNRLGFCVSIIRKDSETVVITMESHSRSGKFFKISEYFSSEQVEQLKDSNIVGVLVRNRLAKRLEELDVAVAAEDAAIGELKFAEEVSAVEELFK